MIKKLYSQYNNQKDHIHGNKIPLYRRDKLKIAIIENKKLLIDFITVYKKDNYACALKLNTLDGQGPNPKPLTRLKCS